MSEKLIEALKETFEYAGKFYTIEEFSLEHGIDIDEAPDVIKVLEDQGLIRYEEDTDIADKNVRNALRQARIFQKAKSNEEDAQRDIQMNLKMKRANKLTHDKVVFEFANETSLYEFQSSVEALFLRNAVTIDDEDPDLLLLEVYNVTEKDCTKLSRLYKLERHTRQAVNATAKAFDNTFKATDYTARNIVAPIAQIGVTGVFSVTKSLLTTVGKLGGVVVSESIKTTKETGRALRDDASILEARAELNRTKNQIKHGLSSHNTNSGATNGIRIEKSSSVEAYDYQ